MGSAPAPHTPGICEDKAQLERSYKEAEAAFDTVRTAIRQKVGSSSKNEYVILARAEDLAWYRLQRAMRELATHIREHGCGISQEAPPPPKPIW
jgi:hypothetical protein